MVMDQKDETLFDASAERRFGGNDRSLPLHTTLLIDPSLYPLLLPACPSSLPPLETRPQSKKPCCLYDPVQGTRTKSASFRIPNVVYVDASLCTRYITLFQNCGQCLCTHNVM